MKLQNSSTWLKQLFMASYITTNPISQEIKTTLFPKSEILDWVIGGKQNSKSEIEIKANEYLSKTDCINRQSNVKIT
jgi:hypothetical protein